MTTLPNLASDFKAKLDDFVARLGKIQRRNDETTLLDLCELRAASRSLALAHHDLFTRINDEAKRLTRSSDEIKADPFSLASFLSDQAVNASCVQRLAREFEVAL